MKKVIKWILIIFAGFIFLGVLFGGGEKIDESAKDNKQAEKQEEDKETPVASNRPAEETPSLEEETETKSKTQYAILSGKDPESNEVILEINIWEKAGAGGRNNVTIGRITHNTKVEVIGNKEVEGNIFYHVRSSVGEISTLPTEWEARKKAMEKRPKEEWFVPATADQPVGGWVSESFITDLE